MHIHYCHFFLMLHIVVLHIIQIPGNWHIQVYLSISPPQPCPPHTYASRPASTSCLTCPPGYNCSNPATNPVSTTCTNTSSPLCPAGFTCGDGGSQQPCPQGKYSFEGQRTCQTCPEGFSCANSSAPPVPTISTTSSSPTNCPTETESTTTCTCPESYLCKHISGY